MDRPAKTLVLASLLALVSCWPASRAAALDVPPLSGRVNDRAGLLRESTKQQLEQRLAAYEQETGHQFALLTLPSLEGDPIEDFSIRVVEQWKLGREGHDDGLLLLVVPQDRAMRVEVGYGLEGDITDALSGRIIRNVMAPRFRKLDFDGGVTEAFELLMQAGRGQEVSPQTAPAGAPERGGSYDEPQRRRGPGLGGLLYFLLIVGFFVLPLFGRRRRRGGFIYLGGFGGGFGGGGFGGGGFGGGGGGFGGGGGGFGGGGASGSW